MVENKKQPDGGTAMAENNKNNTVNADGQTLSAQNTANTTDANQNTPVNEMKNQQTEDQQTQDQKTIELPLEEFEALKSKAEKADEYYDRLLRLSADFDNYKKRMMRERSETIKFANESLVQKLLPILDNFEAALNATSNGNATLDNFKTGVSMIYQQIKNILTEIGLQEIIALNSKFDPMLHEAISEIETNDVPVGNVVAQTRKGYLLNSKLIRPASVIVAKSPSQNDNQASGK
ncbi:MAG: nucleotide exchange factor GrpE [Verrucomicrobiae bacterium]|nr:nucleotide exchange factor GrpE [Verrucomicrobiae bacterium]